MQEIATAELAAAKEFDNLAGLAPYEVLMATYLAHMRGPCVCGRKYARRKKREQNAYAALRRATRVESEGVIS